jgi:hypothetical protein
MGVKLDLPLRGSNRFEYENEVLKRKYKPKRQEVTKEIRKVEIGRQVACMGKVEFLQNPGWEISREITV